VKINCQEIAAESQARWYNKGKTGQWLPSGQAGGGVTVQGNPLGRTRGAEQWGEKKGEPRKDPGELQVHSSAQKVSIGLVFALMRGRLESLFS